VNPLFCNYPNNTCGINLIKKTIYFCIIYIYSLFLYKQNLFLFLTINNINLFTMKKITKKVAKSLGSVILAYSLFINCAGSNKNMKKADLQNIKDIIIEKADTFLKKRYAKCLKQNINDPNLDISENQLIDIIRNTENDDFDHGDFKKFKEDCIQEILNTLYSNIICKQCHCLQLKNKIHMCPNTGNQHLSDYLNGKTFNTVNTTSRKNPQNIKPKSEPKENKKFSDMTYDEMNRYMSKPTEEWGLTDSECIIFVKKRDEEKSKLFSFLLENSYPTEVSHKQCNYCLNPNKVTVKRLPNYLLSQYELVIIALFPFLDLDAKKNLQYLDKEHYHMYHPISLEVSMKKLFVGSLVCIKNTPLPIALNKQKSCIKMEDAQYLKELFTWLSPRQTSILVLKHPSTKLFPTSKKCLWEAYDTNPKQSPLCLNATYFALNTEFNISCKRCNKHFSNETKRKPLTKNHCENCAFKTYDQFDLTKHIYSIYSNRIILNHLNNEINKSLKSLYLNKPESKLQNSHIKRIRRNTINYYYGTFKEIDCCSNDILENVYLTFKNPNITIVNISTLPIFNKKFIKFNTYSSSGFHALMDGMEPDCNDLNDDNYDFTKRYKIAGFIDLLNEKSHKSETPEPPRPCSIM